MPALIPVTVPEVPTLAVPALTLLQVPPVVASVREVDNPEQTDNVPDIAPTDGATFTETIAVAATEPQAFVSV